MRKGESGGQRRWDADHLPAPVRILAFTPSEMGSSEQGVTRSDWRLQQHRLLSREQTLVQRGDGVGDGDLC